MGISCYLSLERKYENIINPTMLTNIPDKIPGKIDIESDSGRIQFFSESWGWADWRIGLTDNEWGRITTEFACSWARSPHVIGAISDWLREITHPQWDLSNLQKNIIQSSRLSDEYQILLTIILTGQQVTVTLDSLTKIPSIDGIITISVTWPVDNLQYIFFQRLVKAMQQDNQENPL